jgi:hypothetical protein
MSSKCVTSFPNFPRVIDDNCLALCLSFLVTGNLEKKCFVGKYKTIRNTGIYFLSENINLYLVK